MSAVSVPAGTDMLRHLNDRSRADNDNDIHDDDDDAYSMVQYNLLLVSELLSHKLMKKSAQRRKHCALAVVSRNQKISPRRRPPSRGRRTAKI